MVDRLRFGDETGELGGGVVCMCSGGDEVLEALSFASKCGCQRANTRVYWIFFSKLNTVSNCYVFRREKNIILNRGTCVISVKLREVSVIHSIYFT